MKPKVSTITLSWNQKEDLAEILRCAQRQTFKPAEIIVVDNGSTDGTQEMIRKKFPKVKFFPLDGNTGYAKGYNICFSKVSKDSDYVVVLDQDIVISDNYIEKIVKRFEKEPESTAILMCDLEEPRIKTFAMKEGYLKAFHGSCWSYRNKYRDIIKFEEAFFAYSNESDLSARLMNRNLKILFYPGCKAYHKHDSTSRGSFRIFLETRNELWKVWRNHAAMDAPISSAFVLAHMYSKASRNSKVGAYLKGLAAAIGGLPYCIRTREVCPYLSWKDYGEANKLKSMLGVSK